MDLITQPRIALDAEPVEAGYAPLQHVTWYKRAQSWMLAHRSARYDALVAPHKLALLSRLAGTVVEIGPGAGANLAFFRSDVRWIGIEPNRFSHPMLRAEGARLGLSADVRLGTAERLPLPDRSVDAVVSTLVLCSVREPAAALREIRRVLRPGGRFVFIEHVAAARGTAARLAQRLIRPVWRAVADGCHPDRETAIVIADAGFTRVEQRRLVLPVPIVGPHLIGIATVD